MLCQYSSANMLPVLQVTFVPPSCVLNVCMCTPPLFVLNVCICVPFICTVSLQGIFAHNNSKNYYKASHRCCMSVGYDIIPKIGSVMLMINNCAKYVQASRLWTVFSPHSCYLLGLGSFKQTGFSCARLSMLY
jgi:hypothetical protein